MPGENDANGVYIYAEDDPASPVSDLLNLGQESVSDALAALADRLNTLETDDTGWQDLSLTNGWTASSPSQAPQWRRVGAVVETHGRVTGGSGIIATLPSGARPPDTIDRIVRDGSTDGSGTNNGAIIISSSGALSPSSELTEPNLSIVFTVEP